MMVVPPLSIIVIMAFLCLSMVLWLVLQSGIDHLHRHSANITELTEYRLSGLFLFTSSRKLLTGYVMCFIALTSLVFSLFDSLVYVVVIVIMLLLAPKLLLYRLESQRRKSISEALPDALAQIAGNMQAGSTLTTAIEAMTAENTGAIGQEFSLLLREQKLGIRSEDALDNLAERVRSDEMDLVVTAAVIAQDVGGNLSEVFQRLSTTLRRKLEMESKIKALTAQGVMQGWVVSFLPFAILAVLWIIEKEAVAPIYNTLLGWIFVVTILVLQLMGAMMIRKIVLVNI